MVIIDCPAIVLILICRIMAKILMLGLIARLPQEIKITLTLIITTKEDTQA